MLTRQPPHLQACELDLSLPDTYSQLNGYGIDVFFARQSVLSSVRKDVRLHSFLTDPQPTFGSRMLIEDVHIGLCGLVSDLWRLDQMRRVDAYPDAACQLHQSLSSRLLYWRKNCVTLEQDSTSNAMLRSAYFGEEEEPDQVMRGLLDETLAFYHLLSLLVNNHCSSDSETTGNLMDSGGLARAALLPPKAMKSVYHALCIGALISSRQGYSPSILQHARIFAREFLETMLEGSCWCDVASSRLELALKDMRLEDEESVCKFPLGRFWLSVNGKPLCACDDSTFLAEVGLSGD